MAVDTLPNRAQIEGTRKIQLMGTWFKRISLFILTNVLILVSVSIVATVLGRFFGVGTGWQGASGAGDINLGALAIFCLSYGFIAAFISLALSRVLAKWMMNVQVIDPRQASGDAAWLVETVHELSRAAGLPKMPEVGIYDSPEVNAFATGPTKSRALVAVSTGLLSRMSRDHVAGVLGHEVAHIANGDMVTMTLLQGIVNAFVMFIARVVASLLAAQVREENQYMVRFGVTILLEIVLGLFGAMLVAYFSRMREYRADAGGARLAGRDRMIGALEALQRTSQLVDPQAPASVAAFKISGKSGGLMALFSTHPPLEERIERLARAPGI